MLIKRYSDFPIIKANHTSRNKRKALFGIGNNDANYKISPTIEGRQVRCPISTLWINMLRDCYSIKNTSRRAFNEQRTICNEWKSFLAFRNWVLSHKEEEWWNKKLVSKGRVYAPETCYFTDKRKRGKNIKSVAKINSVVVRLTDIKRLLDNKLEKDVSKIGSKSDVTEITNCFKVRKLVEEAIGVLNNG